MKVKNLNKKNIIAMIPARIGSTRLKYKNLCLINNKPLIFYSIDSAKKSKIFDNIILNSDNSIFRYVAKRYNIDFYLRPKKYGNNNSKSDDVVFNFLKNYKADILVWVNPIAPLQKPEDIKKITNFFSKSNYDNLYTVYKRKVHSVYKGNEINFKKNIKFQQTQHLQPIEEMTYSLMMWKVDKFLKNFKTYGHAFLKGKTYYYPVDLFSSFIVKKSEDIEILENILRKRKYPYKIKYDKILTTHKII